MHQVGNSSVNSICSKFAIKTKLTFFDVTDPFNKTIQSIPSIIYYVLSFKILQGARQLVGLFFEKGVPEFLVKILHKYTYKEFLKISL